MPLSMVREGEKNVIKKVGGREEARRFLENLGFVVGSAVTIPGLPTLWRRWWRGPISSMSAPTPSSTL